MTSTLYYILCVVLSLSILLGIRLMSNVKTARRGNSLSAMAAFVAVVMTLYYNDILSVSVIWAGIVVGSLIGLWLTARTKMIQMPQTVALLNSFGGLSSLSAAFLTLSHTQDETVFVMSSAMLALMVGAFTFSGSLIAAGKLQQLIVQRPIVLKGHRYLVLFVFMMMLFPMGLVITRYSVISLVYLSLMTMSFSFFFGILFSIRIGGADMPITISLLNSTSGLAAAVAGMAVHDILLVAVGGIVGASGLLLTQIMCRSMNRSLLSILLGSGLEKSNVPATPVAEKHVSPWVVKEILPQETETEPNKENIVVKPKEAQGEVKETNIKQWLQNAKTIILVPGYGMALAQAQTQVKELADKLEAQGAVVRFAIHPVAGRMPGHMNVLLAEVDVSYEKLFELDAINDDFEKTDLVIVVGANDVVNPAANTAENTPIYGMPVLSAEKSKNIIICNYDKQPGYAGVPNPLYEPAQHIALLFGDAKETITQLLSLLE